MEHFGQKGTDRPSHKNNPDAQGQKLTDLQLLGLMAVALVAAESPRSRAIPVYNIVDLVAGMALRPNAYAGHVLLGTTSTGRVSSLDWPPGGR